jgi:protease-4
MSFSTFLRKLGQVLLWVVPPTLILMVAWFAGATLLPQPAVGIIHLDTDIWAGSASLVQAQVEAARDDDQIKAVVFHIDSPGGEVVAIQTIFLEMQSLRKEMPVVASIDSIAASGGYYVAVAADPIYAKPSSEIGNVGVWALVPEELTVTDAVLTTGPFKLTGSNRDEFLQDIEEVRQEFVETVFSHRGDRMQLSRAEISQGLLYPGREAISYGLIDYIGTQSDAVEAAAEQAGINHYETVDLEERVSEEWWGSFAQAETEAATEEVRWIGAADPLTGERSLPYGLYLLYDPRLRGVP